MLTILEFVTFDSAFLSQLDIVLFIAFFRKKSNLSILDYMDVFRVKWSMDFASKKCEENRFKYIKSQSNG